MKPAPGEESQSAGHSHAGALGDMDKRQKLELITAIGLFILGFVFQAFLPANLEVITIGVFLGAYLLAGYRVILLAFRNIGQGQIFDENFLMTIATFGALVLTEWPEAAGVMGSFWDCTISRIGLSTMPVVRLPKRSVLMPSLPIGSAPKARWLLMPKRLRWAMC